ncbi:MAG: flagellar protein FlgN, partial [Clostridiales bacterium]|nr:flagellar protein FlgN [Clostridiales bacterium]
LIEVLIDTLEKENERYEELLKMSREKTGIIIKGDLEALQTITEKEQGVVEVIQALEKKRIETVSDVGNVINRSPKELTITKLIELMANQPETKDKLEQVHDKLKTTINQMIKVNDMNKGLIQESLEMVEFEMNLIHSIRQAPVTANYNKDAYNANVRSSGRGMFDTKQ